ncbi:MAG: HNH endonuclease signature motif containing protein [Cyanobacteria bacterium P01_A01_bin.135]
MNPYYPAVAERAKHRCEYCRAPEAIFNFPFEVEHIVPTARGGLTVEGNLALACRSCNLRKGSRIGGPLSSGGTEVRFFHPRQDQWGEHFQVNIASGELVGKTAIGEVTVSSLEMNSATQTTARKLWVRLGLFP